MWSNLIIFQSVNTKCLRELQSNNKNNYLNNFKVALDEGGLPITSGVLTRDARMNIRAWGAPTRGAGDSPSSGAKMPGIFTVAYKD